MAPVKYTYFDVRGIGETARILLKYGKIDFEDVRIKKEDWPEIKPTTPTGKLPFLEIDDQIVVESYAINRLLARRVGLAGKDEFEQARVDAVADINKDFYYMVAPWFYAAKGNLPGDPAELKVKHFDNNAATFLPLFVKYLKESGSGFVVKSGVTWADFVVTEFLLSLSEQAPGFLEDYPELQEYLARIRTIPELKDYYATRKEE
uniref:glutathione transferase n=1 Tax=Panagrellus redivivus TaxID=6233 RepID=A0A7E4ZSA7_PANRE